MTPTPTSSDQNNPRVQEKAATLQMAGRMALAALQGTLEPAHLVFSLPPSRSHILWLVGHMAVSLDRISAMALGVPFVLPESYAPLFGMGSQPMADAAAYPPFGELSEALARALEAAVGRIQTLADGELARLLPESMPVAKIFPTVDALLTGAAFHTSYHTGQISLLRRAQGLPTGFGV